MGGFKLWLCHELIAVYRRKNGRCRLLNVQEADDVQHNKDQWSANE
jgi:hypothetical protein